MERGKNAGKQAIGAQPMNDFGTSDLWIQILALEPQPMEADGASAEFVSVVTIPPPI